MRLARTTLIGVAVLAGTQVLAGAAAPAPTDPPSATAPTSTQGAPEATTADTAEAAVIELDPGREQAYLAALKKRRVEGEILTLGDAANGGTFALQYAPGPVTAGAVVIAHDLDQHADWDAVVRPLRLGLAGRGRATLSVQLGLLPAGSPRAAYGRVLADAGKRLSGAVAHARAQNFDPVVLLGYGFGALAALQCVAQGGCGVNALVTVSLPAGEEFGAPVDVLKQMAALKVPMLDVHARDDYAEILRAAPLRAEAASRLQLRYRRVALETDHRYLGVDDQLVRVIRSWLQRLKRD